MKAIFKIDGWCCWVMERGGNGCFAAQINTDCFVPRNDGMVGWFEMLV